MPSKINIFNGNTKFVITIIVIIAGFAANWATTKADVRHQSQQIEQKVDRNEYTECIKRIDEKLDSILNHFEKEG